MKHGGNLQSIVVEHVITPGEILDRSRVDIENGKIKRIVRRIDEDLPVDGRYLIPGMIDLHINGAGGGDAARGRKDDLQKMSETLARHGCTGYLATIITDHKDNLLRSLEGLGEWVELDYPGAKPLGIHLEGPFISPQKSGAHRPECIQDPSKEDFLDYCSASGGHMRMLTLAPEMPGGLDLIPVVRSKIPIASVGHTNGDFDCGIAAFRRGANVVTHIFNAMASLHHRRPGILGASMGTPGVSVELIADGIHVHPEVVRVLFRSKGAAEVVLITDAISAAGMPDGRYVVGNVEVEVSDGVCRDAEGRLAGSTLQMDAGIRKLRQWLLADGEWGITDLVATATSQPAALLGLTEKGRIQTGCDADLVLLDENFQVLKTWVGGVPVYDAQNR